MSNNRHKARSSSILLAWPALSAAFLSTLLPVSVFGQADVPYEDPPALRASELLPPEVLRSDDYQISEDVENDGYLNLYRIDSEFGEFEAYGQPLLIIRTREIGALTELDELSKSKVFADAVAEAATRQVKAVQQFADKPVETVKGLPSGLKRTFKRYKRDAEEISDAAREQMSKEEGEGSGDEGSSKVTSDEVEDAAGKYAKKYFGISGAERKWAQKLGTDPYTSNEILRREIKEVAKVDAAGRFAVRLAPIPRIPGASEIATVNSIVWSTDPRELRDRNLKHLAAMGGDEELIERFLDNPWLSPTVQTHLVEALSGLEGIEGAVHLVEIAAEAESEVEALFFLGNARMLSGYHRSRTPLTQILPFKPIPVAVTTENRLVAFGAVDYLAWTEGIATAAITRFTARFDDLVVERRELWLRGEASETCRKGMTYLGWGVFTEANFANEGE